MENDNNELVLQFIPSLAVMLKHAEDMKGTLLTKSEVLEIRDSSTCISVPKSAALALEESRGKDIDPENCWEEWCLLRHDF